MTHRDHRRIYESPDGGKTIYEREFGKTREWSKEVWESQARQAEEWNLFTAMWHARHTDPDIATLLEQAKSLYLLRKEQQ